MLQARWLGRVAFADAHGLQRALFERATDPYLLLLEHPPIYTVGLRGSTEHLLMPVEDLGAPFVRTDRGGDVTWHGPGQLVGYPIITWPTAPDATPAYVRSVEQVVIDACADVGLAGARQLAGYPGVWVDADVAVGGRRGGGEPRKICAIGVRRSRGRTMHGFALNVDPDLSWFDRIVACGIKGRSVTSLAAEGVSVTMAEVVEAIAARAAEAWDGGHMEWAAVAPSGSAPKASVVTQTSDPSAVPVAIDARKPSWLRARVELGEGYRRIRSTMRSLDLVTVCEEAGCPNMSECWSDGTATFMINGERCTRACGFCLVDTRRPSGPPDVLEPERVAEAVERMGLAHAVITAVARDDLPDGGAGAFAEVIAAVRRRCPGTAIEVLIPDCKGDAAALNTIFEARPDILNHNLETVARLQRTVRPSASYARSLSVLGRAAAAGLRAKSGIMVGMGETEVEVRSAMVDVRNVGVDILTVGQYLRPSADHLAVARWWSPEEFDRLRDVGMALGFSHVEASPLARSSYHARAAAAST